MDLLNLLMGSMTNANSIDALAKKTGLGGADLSKLLMKAIPLLMKFLTKNAGSAGGAQSLLTALGGHKDTRSMAAQIENADADDGLKILGHILGNDSDQVVNSLAKETNLNTDQVNIALSNVAPALMSGLSAATTSASKVDLSDGLDLSDLMGMFGGAAGAASNTASAAGGMLDGLLGGSGLGGLLGGGQKSSSGLGGLFGSLLGGSDKKEKEEESVPDGTALLGALTSLLK